MWGRGSYFAVIELWRRNQTRTLPVKSYTRTTADDQAEFVTRLCPLSLYQNMQIFSPFYSCGNRHISHDNDVIYRWFQQFLMKASTLPLWWDQYYHSRRRLLLAVLPALLLLVLVHGPLLLCCCHNTEIHIYIYSTTNSQSQQASAFTIARTATYGLIVSLSPVNNNWTTHWFVVRISRNREYMWVWWR